MPGSWSRRQSAIAYRENALSSPQLYQLTFGAAAPGHTPGPDGTAAALDALVEMVQACIGAGIFRAEEPRFIPQVLTPPLTAPSASSCPITSGTKRKPSTATAL